ncbi:MAG TPA: histidine kinase dimerization/phospho-acceptor domain-containing protein, partial [Nitrospirota bacterium]
MKQGIFTRIFLLYAFVILLALLFIEFSIARTIREQHLADLKQSLVIQASLMEDRISFSRPQGLDAVCREAREKTGARITIIARDGRVIGDSDVSSMSLENHASRPEVLEAELAGTGMAIRRSDTLKQDLLYAALRVPVNGKPEGYIRLSVPLQEIDRAVNATRLRIIIFVGLIIAATGAFSLWQLGRLRSLTHRIKDFAGTLLPGGIGKRLYLQDAGEFSDIADSLNAMSEELKAVIREHERERNRLHEILRSIPDALVIMNDKGIVQLASAASAEFFGETPLADKPFIQLVRNTEFFSLLEEVRSGRTPGISELKLHHPTERYCVVRISPLFQGKDLLSGFIAVFHDITELKKTEQVRKDFVANASHEIKTPITAIRGFADTLLEGALDDREHAVKFLRAIRSNSERINSLVDDLMTISRIEMGALRIEKRPIQFSEAAEAVLALLKDKAASKNISLRADVQPGNRDIMADRDRLIQILTNLVENGIKFTEKGGVTFGIRTENDRSVIFVQDTGIGV